MNWKQFGVSFLIQLPSLAIWVVGIIVAVANWRRYPKVALWTTVAMLIFIADGIGGSLLYLVVLDLLQNPGWSSEETSLMMTVLNLARAFFRLGGWIILLIALFRWRNIPLPTGPRRVPPDWEEDFSPPPRGGTRA